MFRWTDVVTTPPPPTAFNERLDTVFFIDDVVAVRLEKKNKLAAMTGAARRLADACAAHTRTAGRMPLRDMCAHLFDTEPDACSTLGYSTGETFERPLIMYARGRYEVAFEWIDLPLPRASCTFKPRLTTFPFTDIVTAAAAVVRTKPLTIAEVIVRTAERLDAADPRETVRLDHFIRLLRVAGRFHFTKGIDAGGSARFCVELATK